MYLYCNSNAVVLLCNKQSILFPSEKTVTYVSRNLFIFFNEDKAKFKFFIIMLFYHTFELLF